MNHKIVLIFLLFLIPAILAQVFYHHQNWLPKHTLNHGQLVTPSISLKDWKLDPKITQHRWVLLFLHQGTCEAPCQRALYNMQQIQRALGKDMNRLQRAVITGPNSAVADNISPWRLSAEDLAGLEARHSFWYVIDPLGNIILNYPETANPEAILDDLKYLMGVSNIG